MKIIISPSECLPLSKPDCVGNTGTCTTQTCIVNSCVTKGCTTYCFAQLCIPTKAMPMGTPYQIK